MDLEKLKDINRTLSKQLTRLKINVDGVPTLEQWQALLLRVSATYTQGEEERYLLERAFNVSSQEIIDAKEKELSSPNL